MDVTPPGRGDVGTAPYISVQPHSIQPEALKPSGCGRLVAAPTGAYHSSAGGGIERNLFVKLQLPNRCADLSLQFVINYAMLSLVSPAFWQAFFPPDVFHRGQVSFYPPSIFAMTAFADNRKNRRLRLRT